MLHRFSMNFDNFGPSRAPLPRPTNNLASQVSQAPKRIVPLNANMIDRVHKAKPGCSACGKKVA
jgi:hypothetical protein